MLQSADATAGGVWLSSEYRSEDDFIRTFDMESMSITKINEVLDKGNPHFAFLFTYRSIGQVCAQVNPLTTLIIQGQPGKECE